MQERLGVTVDWQRYSWIELEALRRTLMSFGGCRGRRRPGARDGLAVRPTFKDKGRPVARGGAGRSTDPDGVIRPTFTGRAEAPIAARDPDGVIRPTFAVRPALVVRDGRSGWADCAYVRAQPAFAPIGDMDDLIDPMHLPAPTRTQEGRSTPARW